ncbi:uncharacterized protein LOC142163868 [Nicotiana tabacum]|uniref:Uncharacterized protein LOC142163868 n=1 Tax=Nicotiana tabacum TaxID=4097 RepID=A0AC58RWJ4_TOBAC
MERKRHRILTRYDRYSLEVAIHKLSINPNFPPIKQKKLKIAETAIKSQVLADFSSKMTPLAAKEAVLVLGTTSDLRTLFTDGVSNVKGSGLGIVLITPLGEILRRAIQTALLTNNEAEYEDMVAGLELSRGLGFEMIEGVVEIHIPREENMEADALAKLGSSTEIKRAYSGAVVQLLHSVLDTDGYCEVNSTNLVWDWRNKFIEYLRHGKLHANSKASRALRTKVAQFCLVDGQLYRRPFQGLFARCLGLSEVDYMMREVHEGVYKNQSGADSLVLKLIRADYYWPRMEQDAKTFVHKCDKCQHYAQLVHQLAELCHHGAFKEIEERGVIDFIWDHIIFWFRIPKEITRDNGPQFKGSKITKFLEGLKMKRITSSPYHPSANGQPESTNKVIIQNLKRKLEDAKGRRHEELPGILLAYRTTAKSSTGEMPFSLVYGAEALIPVEINE